MTGKKIVKTENKCKWDKKVPVEESNYIWKDKPKLIKKNLNDNPFTVVDLFCGAGGASEGFISAGFNVILGIDHLKPAMDTFLYNHKNSAGILGDIKDVTEEMVKNCIGNTDVKVIIGGVPCQGFSLSNRKRNEDDPRNKLFYEFIRFIEMLKPDMFMLENVSGMKSMSKGKVVKTIESEMAKSGYKIGKNYKIEHKLLNAADYGVPQLRNRLIFLGVSEKYTIKWPTKLFGENNYRTVYDAISDLPSLKAKEEKTKYESDPLTEFQKQLRGDSNEIFNNISPNHPQKTIEKIANTEPGEPMYEKYKQRIRLSWDKPSPTQVCGGIRPQFQFGHPRDNRGLTIRERARIQSFPDSYNFLGGIVQGRVQTGNAVPPLLAESIAKQLIIQFNNNTYR